MWKVVKAGPAFEARDPGERAAPRRVVRAVWVQAAARVARFARDFERVEPAVQERRVPVEERARYAVRGVVGVGVVEAAVIFAVAAYFVAGVIGVFVF